MHGANYALAICLSVRLSVCLSHARIQMAKHIIKHFTPSDGQTVTFCDSTLNTANLCPAISVVGLFYLFTVMFTFVVDIESYGVDFTRRFRFCMCV